MLITLPSAAQVDPQALLDSRSQTAPAKPRPAQSKSGSQQPAQPRPTQPRPGSSKPAIAKQPPAQTTARPAAKSASQRAAATPRPAAARPATAQKRTAPPPPVDSIWDDEGPYSVTAEAEAPCAGCGSPWQPGAVLCVQCGYNMQTGQTVLGAKPKAPSKPSLFARWKISKWWLLAPAALGALIGLIFPMLLMVFAMLSFLGSMVAFFVAAIWYFGLNVRYHPGNAVFMMFQLFLACFGIGMYRRGDGNRRALDPRYDGPRRLFKWAFVAVLGGLIGLVLAAGGSFLHGEPFPPRPAVRHRLRHSAPPNFPPPSGWDQPRVQ